MLLDLKVKKSSILLAVYLFSMFLPGFFSNQVMQIVSNIMMVGVAIYLFSVKYKPSRFMILTICYFAYLIVITFIYHNKYNIPITVDTRISVVPTFRTPSPFVSLFINTPLSNTFFLDTLFQM